MFWASRLYIKQEVESEENKKKESDLAFVSYAAGNRPPGAVKLTRG